MSMTNEQLLMLRRKMESTSHMPGSQTGMVCTVIDDLLQTRARVGELEAKAEQDKEGYAEMEKLKKHYYQAYKEECKKRDKPTAQLAEAREWRERAREQMRDALCFGEGNVLVIEAMKRYEQVMKALIGEVQHD